MPCSACRRCRPTPPAAPAPSPGRSRPGRARAASPSRCSPATTCRRRSRSGSGRAASSAGERETKPMSFRSFIYYCSLGGGCAAYLGWVLGRLPPLEQSVGRAAVQGMFLGMALAVGLTLIDALWNLAASEGLQVGWRVLVGGFVGGLGGFTGGALGQLLYGRTRLSVFVLLGWAFTGLLIGLAPGLYDLFARLMRDEDTRGARRKVLNGLLG